MRAEEPPAGPSPGGPADKYVDSGLTRAEALEIAERRFAWERRGRTTRELQRRAKEADADRLDDEIKIKAAHVNVTHSAQLAAATSKAANEHRAKMNALKKSKRRGKGATVKEKVASIIDKKGKDAVHRAKRVMAGMIDLAVSENEDMMALDAERRRKEERNLEHDVGTGGSLLMWGRPNTIKRSKRNGHEFGDADRAGAGEASTVAAAAAAAAAARLRGGTRVGREVEGAPETHTPVVVVRRGDPVIAGSSAPESSRPEDDDSHDASAAAENPTHPLDASSSTTAAGGDGDGGFVISSSTKAERMTERLERQQRQGKGLGHGFGVRREEAAEVGRISQLEERRQRREARFQAAAKTKEERRRARQGQRLQEAIDSSSPQRQREDKERSLTKVKAQSDRLRDIEQNMADKALRKAEVREAEQVRLAEMRRERHERVDRVRSELAEDWELELTLRQINLWDKLDRAPAPRHNGTKASPTAPHGFATSSPHISYGVPQFGPPARSEETAAREAKRREVLRNRKEQGEERRAVLEAQIAKQDELQVSHKKRLEEETAVRRHIRDLEDAAREIQLARVPHQDTFRQTKLLSKQENKHLNVSKNMQEFRAAATGGDATTLSPAMINAKRKELQKYVRWLQGRYEGSELNDRLRILRSAIDELPLSFGEVAQDQDEDKALLLTALMTLEPGYMGEWSGNESRKTIAKTGTGLGRAGSRSEVVSQLHERVFPNAPSFAGEGGGGVEGRVSYEGRLYGSGAASSSSSPSASASAEENSGDTGGNDGNVSTAGLAGMLSSMGSVASMNSGSGGHGKQTSMRTVGTMLLAARRMTQLTQNGSPPKNDADGTGNGWGSGIKLEQLAMGVVKGQTIVHSFVATAMDNEAEKMKRAARTRNRFRTVDAMRDVHVEDVLVANRQLSKMRKRRHSVEMSQAYEASKVHNIQRGRARGRGMAVDANEAERATDQAKMIRAFESQVITDHKVDIVRGGTVVKGRKESISFGGATATLVAKGRLKERRERAAAKLKKAAARKARELGGLADGEEEEEDDDDEDGGENGKKDVKGNGYTVGVSYLNTQYAGRSRRGGVGESQKDLNIVPNLLAKGVLQDQNAAATAAAAAMAHRRGGGGRLGGGLLGIAPGLPGKPAMGLSGMPAMGGLPGLSALMAMPDLEAVNQADQVDQAAQAGVSRVRTRRKTLADEDAEHIQGLGTASAHEQPQQVMRARGRRGGLAAMAVEDSSSSSEEEEAPDELAFWREPKVSESISLGGMMTMLRFKKKLRGGTKYDDAAMEHANAFVAKREREKAYDAAHAVAEKKWEGEVKWWEAEDGDGEGLWGSGEGDQMQLAQRRERAKDTTTATRQHVMV